jgi:hypothetical protein
VLHSTSSRFPRFRVGARSSYRAGAKQLPFDWQGSGAGKAAGAKQLPFDWQGRGAGRAIGAGPLTALDIWLGSVCILVELKDAEARPTKATSRAKTRTATFIFGNLFGFGFEGEFSPRCKAFYRIFGYKTRFFFMIIKPKRNELLT